MNKRIISVEIGLFFQEITFITEFPGSNFLLPTFLTGGKWDFQVANLSLATINFEPCICLLTKFLKIPKGPHGLVIPTSNHKVAGFSPAGGKILTKSKRHFIAQSPS